jgi:hypothetical protein
MDPRLRTAILVAGLAFCVIFLLMTIAVAISSQFDILTVASLLIIAMVATGLIGAIQEPPDE